MSTKTPIPDIDATPVKRLFLSIIADYNLKTAICELIDNAIDAWRSSARNDTLQVLINIDVDQQSIAIQDNACGVAGDELRILVAPGETASKGIDDGIGIFGVGSKRSVVALAQDVSITTRYENERTHRIEFDDEWINDAGDWKLPAFEVSHIAENSTLIELSRLRFRIEDEDVEDLKTHLSYTNAIFIEEDKIELVFGEELIKPEFFTQWAYPKGFEPRKITKDIVDRKRGKTTSFEITAGLTSEPGSLFGDYGVFLYCNRRLITRALRSSEVGFVSGLAGIPHHDMNLARVIVRLTGEPEQMPWTSKKDGINYNHPTFQSLKADIITTVVNSVKLSKSLKPEFSTKVQPYKTGKVVETSLNSSDAIRPNRLPTPPKFRKDYKEDILTLNKPLGLIKPWTKGLFETVIAEAVISRQSVLTQKNRISLILLDSTIEIGCKEFLKHKIDMSQGDIRKLDRLALHREVAKHVLTGDDIWSRFRRYYEFRNTFIHETAGLTASDGTIDSFRNDVKTFLSAAFKIRFPENS
jgi:Histidine kinase-, DNA gyrase B-, and HSP90-like ATPase